MSAGKHNHKVGFKEKFEKSDWAQFKRDVAKYCRDRDHRDAMKRRSTLTITPRVKEVQS